MIFGILFNVVGFGMLGTNFYLSMKIFPLAVSIRNSNAHLIGKAWNGRVVPKQLKSLKAAITGENSKQAIDKFLRYWTWIRNTMIVSIILFLLIGIINSALNN